MSKIKFSFLTKFLLLIIIVFFLLNTSSLYADSYTHKLWVDTSHWESIATEWVLEGHYETQSGRRWVDTSYTVHQGYWQDYTENVWVSEGHWEYGDRVWVKDGYWEVTDYNVWVKDSYWKTKRYWYWTWVPCKKVFIYGGSSYTWSTLSIFAKKRGRTTHNRGGVLYKCYKRVINYQPHYNIGGIPTRLIRYDCYLKRTRASYTNTYWVDTSHWEKRRVYDWIDTSHWEYNRVWVDTSHWETQSGRRWVDTSYTVNQGHWEDHTETIWVDTSHWKYEDKWVEDGFYTSPLHGELIIEKSPEYVFTKWHEDSQNKECCMELDISWRVDNSNLSEGEEEKEITRLYIYEDIFRFNNKGTERVIIFDGNVPQSAEGSINTSTKFEYSGSEDSMLYIYLFAQNGESACVSFSNPVNGFRSINLNPDDGSINADSWLGGITYEKFEF